MWPWEHVLLAYIFYSILCHIQYSRSPNEIPVVAVAVGSLFPDIVDKPLAWQYGVFETGWGIAHSVFFALPFSILIYLLFRYRGNENIGGAFAIGYLLHLPADVIPVSLNRGKLYLDPILWPVGNPTVGRDHESFSDGFLYLLTQYGQQILAGDITLALAIQLGTVILGLALWVFDGTPGLKLVLRPVRKYGSRRIQ